MRVNSFSSQSVRALAILVVGFLCAPHFAYAATGVPKILNYQGRLMNSSGVLLGGSGTEYCFTFSLYDNATVGSGSKLWPSGNPSTSTVTVKNGIFSVGIGDTSVGGDTLDFNFETTDAAYLNVMVATKVGTTCAPGDGVESYETLGPRPRIYSSGYAVNASTLNGYNASQIIALGFSTTSADYLISQRNFFSTTSAEHFLSLNQGAAFSTTSAQHFLSTYDKGYFFSTTSAEHFLSQSQGIAFSTTSANHFVDASTTIAKTYSNNDFGGYQRFQNSSTTNASTTNLSASYASSTRGFFGALSVGVLTGVLKAVGGAVTAGLIDLTSEVTGILLVANGGTGWSSVASGAVLFGNGTGALATTTAGLPGQVLALLGGVPTWTATTTFSSGLTYSAGNVSLDAAFDKGFFFSSTSAQHFVHSSTTIPKTYTSNTFLGTQTFDQLVANNASSTTLFAAVSSGVDGVFGNLFATSSATFASTTAYGKFITGNVISTSTATSSFNGPLSVNVARPSSIVSIMGAITAPTSATGTAILTVSNDNNTLSSGNNVVRLNIRTPLGTNCTAGTTCPRFIEFFTGAQAGSDSTGSGVGRIMLSTNGTGITQTSGAADFAEYMQLNSSAEIGDLVSLNSAGQYQKAVAGQSLIGVVSDNPAFVGNAGIEGSPNAYIVGFAGVIRTTVSAANGPISAGDFVAASSTTAGVGVKLVNSGFTLGQALQAFSGAGTGTVTVLVLPKYVDAAVALENYGGSNGGVSGYWNLSTSTGVVTLASSTYSLLVSYGTITNASTTAITSANASTTNLTISSVSGGLLKTDGTGRVTAAVAGVDYAAVGEVNFSTTSTDYWSTQRNFFATTSADFWKTQNNFFSTTSADFLFTQRNFFSTTSADWWKGQNNFFATTSADYFLSQRNLFSTTSADYFASQRNFFSTTSADYWKGVTDLFSTTSANYFAASSTTIPKTYTANTFSALQTFANASTTNISASYASSTQGFFGSLVSQSLTIGALNGVLRATAGAVSTGLVDLASEVTGVLGVNRGGTGWASLASGAVLYGNGTGAVATTTAGLPGQTLALLGGVPTWTSTTTFSNGLVYANGNVTLDTSGNWSGTLNGYTAAQIIAQGFSTTSADYYVTQANLSAFSTTSADYWKTQRDFFATTSAEYFLSQNQGAAFSTTSAIHFVHSSTTIAKSYANNIFTGNNVFNGSLTFGTLNGPLQANDGVVSATTSVSVLYGGTGVTSFAYGLVASAGGTAPLTNIATSSLGLLTTDVAEGTNQYWTNARFDSRLSATTSLPNIVTLANLSLPATQLTGFGLPFYQFFSATTTDALTEGSSNRYYTDGRVQTYLATIDKGFFFSTTSANAWKLVNNFFSTTSVDYWKSENNFFSTTSAEYFAHASSTIPKTYTNNTFSGTQNFDKISFNYSSSTVFSSFETASTSNLTISSIAAGSLLKTTTGGAVVAAVAGTDYLTSATTMFATTSADFWKTQRDFFSTTSVDWWKTQRDFFATTSADYFLTQRNLFSTTSTDYWKSVTDLFSTTSATYFAHSSTTVAKTYANNTFQGTQTFAGASTTLISSSYASSTQGFFGSLFVGALNGVLRATTGAVATGLVDLATEVTGILGVSRGGTGWANVASGAILFGNGTGALSTTTAAAPGQILAYLGGAPTWVSTTTYSGPLSWSANNVTIVNAAADGSTKGAATFGTNDFNDDGSGLISLDYANGQKASGSQAGFLSSPDWTSFNNKISSTSLSASYPLQYNASTGIFNLAFGTTTAQNWSQLQTFTSGLLSAASSTIGDGTEAGGLYISGGATTTGTAYFGGLVGIGTTSPGSPLAIGNIANFTVGTSSIYSAGGIDLKDGCFSVRGVCVEEAPIGTNVILTAVRTYTSTTTWTVPSNLIYAVVEIWGAGGGGGDGDGNGDGAGGGGAGGYAMKTFTAGALSGTSSVQAFIGTGGGINASGNGNPGGDSNFGGWATSTGGQGGIRGANAGAVGGDGGTGQGGDINLSGEPGGASPTAAGGTGGSAPRGGGGGVGGQGGTGTGAPGLRFGGGGGGGSGVGGIGAVGGIIVYEYTADIVSVSGGGSINSGTAGQFAFYNSSGQVLSGTSLLFVDTANSFIGVGTTSPGSLFSINDIANFTAATTSIYSAGGIDLKDGCFSIDGVCISGSGGAADGDFSTTSADYWQSQRNFFATTSADYWKSQNNFFSTSSADFLFSQRNFFSTTSADWWKSQNSFFATTSADYFLTQRNLFSTTSTDYWKTQNNFFSTTSADYFLAQNIGAAFSTTSAIYFAHSSTTIAKTYSNNIFTGNNIFNGALTFGTLNGPLQANAGVVSATSSIGVLYGGTGLTSAPSYGNLLIGTASGGYALAATSTLGIFLTDTVGTLPESRGGTNQTAYVKGDILYASADNVLARLPIGGNGEVLKVNGSGVPSWGMDLQSGGGGGGGGGFFSTTTDSLAIFPSNPAYVVMVGQTSTSTADSIFEVSGRSYFSNRIGIGTTSPGSLLSINDVANFASTGSTFYTSLFAPSLTATYASTTVVTSTLASTTDLIISQTPSTLLATDAEGRVSPYAGTGACSNQFIRAVNGAGVATCATVQNTDLANSSITINTSGIATGGGSVSLGSSITINASSSPTVGYVYGTSTRSSVFPYASSTALTAGELFSTNATTTTSFASISSSTILYGAALTNCAGGFVLTWTDGRFGCAQDQQGGGGGSFPFTPTTFGSTPANATTTVLIGFTQGIYALASSTIQNVTIQNSTTTNATTTSLAITNITNGLTYVNGSGSVGKVTIGSGVSFSGSTLSLDLASQNVWTGLQRFQGNASTTQVSAGLAYFGQNATTTIDGYGNIGFGSSTPWVTLQNGTNRALNFGTSTANIPTLTISTRASMNGLVGIGTSTPWARFSVEASGDGPVLAVGSSTATYFLINNGGRVGIGTTSPAASFAVSGTVFVNGTSTHTQGINLTGGCFAVNGTCIGNIVKLTAVRTYTATSTWAVPGDLSYAVVEIWGAGGGGGDGDGTGDATGGGGSGGYAMKLLTTSMLAGTTSVQAFIGTGGAVNASAAGSNGSDSNFGGIATSTGGQGGSRTAGTGVAAGGDGGVGQGGDINVSGEDGGSSFSSANNATVLGGNGGSAPRGGGGGFGNTGTASPGASFGGGGGGGMGVGGIGGVGGVVVYEYTTQMGGADIAENYPVATPDIGAGDIVSFDIGMPITVKHAEKNDNRPLAGVISTKPGITLGDEGVAAAGQRPVALSGRVPVRFSNENGEVQIGDRITLSSTPGAGMRAGPFDDSVGIVIAPVEHTEKGDTVMIFMDLQRGTDINAIAFSLLGSDSSIFGDSISGTTTASTTASGSIDFVGGMMKAIGFRLSSISLFGVQSSSTASTSTPETASSASSAVDSFAQGLLQSIFDKLTQILATAGNGIGSIFANAIHAKEEICVDDQCLSKEDIKAMKAKLMKSQTASSGGASTPPPPPPAPTHVGEPPVLEVQGNNPATINVGQTYNDLGAIITGPEEDMNLGIDYLVDGLATEEITIDTSFPAEHVIKYRVIDTDGNVSEAERIVRVVSLVAPEASSSTPEALDDEATSTPETAPLPPPESAEQPSASSTEPASGATSTIQNP